MTRALLLMIALLSAGPAAAQDGIVLGVDPGDGALGEAFAAGASVALGAGGSQAGCAATVVAGALGASHAVRLAATPGADGAVAWTLEVVAQPGGEVVATAQGEGPVEEAGRAAAEAALAAVCPPLGGGGSAWEASGGGAEIAITGRVTSLETVFTLQGTFPGGTAEFTYTPVSPGGGAVEYAAAGSGVTASGEGIYSLTPQGDGTIRLEQTTDGCVDGIPNSCRTNTEVITLTPVAP